MSIIGGGRVKKKALEKKVDGNKSRRLFQIECGEKLAEIGFSRNCEAPRFSARTSLTETLNM